MSKKATITMPVELQLRVPTVPNFIIVGTSDAESTIPLSSLSEDQLRTIGEKWTEALIEKAKKG